MTILVGGLSALLGIGMTIFGLMAKIVYPLCWGYEWPFSVWWLSALLGVRDDHFDRKGLSALLGIGMTIFGLMAEPNDRLPTHP